MGNNTPELVIDQSDATGWSTNYTGYQGPCWRVMFSSSFPIYLLKMATSAPNTITLRGYDGTSWVVITTFTGSITLNFNGSVSYSGFQLDTTQNGYTNIFTFAVTNFEEAFVFNTDPVTISGVECDDDLIGQQIITGSSGFLLDSPETVTIGTNEVSIISGKSLSELEYFSRESRNFTGHEETNLFELASNTVNNKIGYFIDDGQIGIRSRNRFNVLLSDIELGVRARNTVGKNIDDIIVSSQASTTYVLTVTPTHQHKSMPVTVTLVSRSTVAITGKYSVTLNGSIIIQPAFSDEAMNNVEFTISPSQLKFGLNKARIKLFYPDGTQEYLDFEIVKEEIKRTTAQRLFRNYDGGFTGDIYAPPKILIPSTYPCWMPPNNAISGVVKTTDYTRISLLHYTDVQGVLVVGNNLNILVSFDKGVTWKSFISNVWTTVDISNIKTYGMTVATINAITIAQWSDTFAPMSIDFAICLNNDLNTVTTLKSYSLTPTLDGTWESFSR